MTAHIKKEKETKLLTARELSVKPGVSPAVLRKLLRQEFNRVGKVLVEGNSSEYRFNLNDAVTKQIIARAKELKGQPKKPQKSTHVMLDPVIKPVVEEKSKGD